MHPLNDEAVFVAGLERTGTSLMYALLTSHSQIAMTRRTNFWRYFVDQYGDLAVDENLDLCLATMQVYKRLVALDVDFARLREDFVRGDRSYGRLFALMERQVAAREGKPRWGDKSLNIERYADQLLDNYPRARILHMIRDPRDRLASAVSRWGHRRSSVATGTAAWVWSARLADSNRTRHPDNYRVVRYESLVSDPERELREICDFIGADYEGSMIEMGSAGRFRERGSNSSYGARPVGEISTTSIKKYQNVLTPRQVALVQRSAGHDMARYGYCPDDLALTPAERLRVRLVDHPAHLAVASAWRTREAVDNRRGRPLPDYRKVGEPAL